MTAGPRRRLCGLVPTLLGPTKDHQLALSQRKFPARPMRSPLIQPQVQTRRSPCAPIISLSVAVPPALYTGNPARHGLAYSSLRPQYIVDGTLLCSFVSAIVALQEVFLYKGSRCVVHMLMRAAASCIIGLPTPGSPSNQSEPDGCKIALSFPGCWCRGRGHQKGRLRNLKSRIERSKRGHPGDQLRSRSISRTSYIYIFPFARLLLNSREIPLLQSANRLVRLDSSLKIPVYTDLL